MADKGRRAVEATFRIERISCSGAGRLVEAKSEFEAAAALTRNGRERAFLLARAAACEGPRAHP